MSKLEPAWALGKGKVSDILRIEMDNSQSTMLTPPGPTFPSLFNLSPVQFVNQENYSVDYSQGPWLRGPWSTDGHPSFPAPAI